MKYRFAVEVELPLAQGQTQDQAQSLLALALAHGFTGLGHSSTTVQYSVEKIRQRSLDLDKKVGEQ